MEAAAAEAAKAADAMQVKMTVSVQQAREAATANSGSVAGSMAVAGASHDGDVDSRPVKRMKMEHCESGHSAKTEEVRCDNGLFRYKAPTVMIFRTDKICSQKEH